MKTKAQKYLSLRNCNNVCNILITYLRLSLNKWCRLASEFDVFSLPYQFRFWLLFRWFFFHWSYQTMTWKTKINDMKWHRLNLMWVPKSGKLLLQLSVLSYSWILNICKSKLFGYSNASIYGKIHLLKMHIKWPYLISNWVYNWVALNIYMATKTSFP